MSKIAFHFFAAQKKIMRNHQEIIFALCKNRKNFKDFTYSVKLWDNDFIRCQALLTKRKFDTRFLRNSGLLSNLAKLWGQNPQWITYSRFVCYHSAQWNIFSSFMRKKRMHFCREKGGIAHCGERRKGKMIEHAMRQTLTGRIANRIIISTTYT